MSVEAGAEEEHSPVTLEICPSSETVIQNGVPDLLKIVIPPGFSLLPMTMFLK